MALMVGLCNLFPMITERLLFHFGGPASLELAASSGRPLAATLSPGSPRWRDLLAKQVNLTSIPTTATFWEVAHHTWWDESAGEPTAEDLTFSPPLRRVRGWVGAADPTGQGTFLYVDNRAAAASCPATYRLMAAVTKSPSTAEADDPRSLFMATALTSVAGAALIEATSNGLLYVATDVRLWSPDFTTDVHVWAVRVEPDFPWPPPSGPSDVAGWATAPPPEAHVHAAAMALLDAAGVAPKSREPIVTPQRDDVPPMWSGLPAAALYRRAVSDTVHQELRRMNPLGCGVHLECRNLRRATVAANEAVEALLGDRPALLFSWGDQTSMPFGGGVLAVRWSPTVVVGLLGEATH